MKDTFNLSLTLNSVGHKLDSVNILGHKLAHDKTVTPASRWFRPRGEEVVAMTGSRSGSSPDRAMIATSEDTHP